MLKKIIVTSKIITRIKRELIVPYNSQQIRVEERKNKANVGVAKAMLYD
jgi:hypothetical protein